MLFRSMCIGALVVLGLWGIYGIVVREWNSRRYFAFGIICFIAIAEEYGINLIIDEFLGATTRDKSFVLLECMIMLLLAAASFGIGCCRTHKKE